jgi:hypothetical protein
MMGNGRTQYSDFYGNCICNGHGNRGFGKVFVLKGILKVLILFVLPGEKQASLSDTVLNCP